MAQFHDPMGSQRSQLDKIMIEIISRSPVARVVVRKFMDSSNDF